MKAGELWPADMKPYVDCLNQQRNWISFDLKPEYGSKDRGRIYDK